MASLLLPACERKTVVIETVPATPAPEPIARTKTLETARLGSAVDRFEQEPTAGHQAEVKKALAELDGEIAELEERVAKRAGDERAEAAVKLRNLQDYRTAETTRFTVAQAKHPLAPETSALPDGRSGADKLQDAAGRVGDSVEKGARNVGDAIKDATR